MHYPCWFVFLCFFYFSSEGTIGARASLRRSRLLFRVVVRRRDLFDSERGFRDNYVATKKLGFLSLFCLLYPRAPKRTVWFSHPSEGTSCSGCFSWAVFVLSARAQIECRPTLGCCAPTRSALTTSWPA